MSIFERLMKLNLSDDTNVTFEYSDGEDVIHCNDGYEEKAIQSTNTASALSEALVKVGEKFTNEWGTDILGEMRDDDLLEGYERGSYGFEGYLHDVITDNFYDYDWLNTETEHYDYKRGFTTVTARLQASWGDIKDLSDRIDAAFSGWDAVIKTESGTITLND